MTYEELNKWRKLYEPLYTANDRIKVRFLAMQQNMTDEEIAEVTTNYEREIEECVNSFMGHCMTNLTSATIKHKLQTITNYYRSLYGLDLSFNCSPVWVYPYDIAKQQHPRFDPQHAANQPVRIDIE